MLKKDWGSAAGQSEGQMERRTSSVRSFVVDVNGIRAVRKKIGRNLAENSGRSRVNAFNETENRSMRVDIEFLFIGSIRHRKINLSLLKVDQ